MIIVVMAQFKPATIVKRRPSLRCRFVVVKFTVVAGCSSIEINGYLHRFVVSDDSHPEIKEIHLKK
jgi:hypothetical protein